MTGLRIAYFAEIFPSKSETWIHHEIDQLRALGCEVRVFASHPRPIGIAEELKRFCEYTVYLPEQPRPPLTALRALANKALLIPFIKGFVSDTPTLRLKAQIVRDLLFAGFFFPHVQQFRPDVLFAHFGGSRTNLAMFQSALIGKPFAFKMHAADVFTRVALFRLKSALAKWIGTISRFNIEFMKQSYPDTAASPFTLHRCGLPLATFEYAPKRALNSPPRIIAVGRMVKTKGFDILIRASHEMKRGGLRHSVSIIGDGPQRLDLERLIDSLDLRDTVRLLGYCSPGEVQQALREADSFVLPVTWDPILNIPEGVPVALMEAMAVGLPVVSARTAGIPELIDDGITGFLANPDDPSDLAEVVSRLFALPESHRAKITQAARDKIVAQHDIEKLTNELHLALLKTVASSGTLPTAEC
ncbi:MAG: Glycostransf1 domain-containing protein [Nitrospira sp.]|nr:MAG: Glycostransf1 domain-containing protein [Nitrospira sp.]